MRSKMIITTHAVPGLQMGSQGSAGLSLGQYSHQSHMLRPLADPRRILRSATVKLKFRLLLAALVLGPPGSNLASAQEATSSRLSATPGTHCAGQARQRSSGKVEACVLLQPYAFDGIELPAGSKASFREDGKVEQVRLNRDSPVYGQMLPAGTTLFFKHTGGLRHFWLPMDTVIQEHLVWGHEDGAGNQLHPNGKLKAIWLATDETIDGVPCTSSGNPLRVGLRASRLGTQRMVWFYDSGRLQQAMVSREFTLQGHTFKTGDVISLGPDGRIDLNAKRLSQW